MDTMVKQDYIDGHSAVDHNVVDHNPLFRPWDCRENQSQLAVSNSEKVLLPEGKSKSFISSKLSSSQSKMIFSSPEKPTKQSLKSTEPHLSFSSAAAAAFAMNHHRTPANLLSLMSNAGHHHHHHYPPHHLASCFPQGGKQFGPPPVAPVAPPPPPPPPPPSNVGANLNGSNPLKSANQRCQPISFPPLVPESIAGFMTSSVPTSNGQIFSFPNLFAYNAFNAAAAAAAAASFHANGHHHHNHQSHHLETLMTATNKALQLSSANPSVAELEKLTIEQQQQHHPNGLLERTPKKQRPKRFQCPHCQVSFSNNGQLKGHIRIHTGERPFVCDQGNCGKTFTRNEELTRHKRIHTGLRPFACSVCNKRFGRKDHLKKHVKTHQRPPPIPMPLSLDPALSYAALAYSWL